MTACFMVTCSSRRAAEIRAFVINELDNAGLKATIGPVQEMDA